MSLRGSFSEGDGSIIGLEGTQRTPSGCSLRKIEFVMEFGRNSPKCYISPHQIRHVAQSDGIRFRGCGHLGPLGSIKGNGDRCGVSHLALWTYENMNINYFGYH